MSGHRTVPHTADLRVEAWAPTRELCIAEAVVGAVESFADTAYSGVTSRRVARLHAVRDEDLLVAVLDEVIFRLETAAEIPVAVDVGVADRGVEARFTMAPAAELSQVGAVPKAVSLHELHLAPGPHGWSCSVILDV